MLTKTRALVLRCTPYGDHAVVARLLTRELGAYSYMLHGIRSKKARITPAMLHPMALLEAEVLHRPDSDLQRVPELQPLPSGPGGYGTARQLLAAGLIAELLSQSVHDHDPQPDLFDWLVDRMEALMGAAKPAEIVFAILTELPGWLGFSVDESTYHQGSRLNFVDGVFVGPGVIPVTTNSADVDRYVVPFSHGSSTDHATSAIRASSTDSTTAAGQPTSTNHPTTLGEPDSAAHPKTSAQSSSSSQTIPIQQPGTASPSTNAPHPNASAHSERGSVDFKSDYADPQSSFEMAFYLSQSRWPDNFQSNEAYLQALYGLYARHLPSFRIPRSHAMFCSLLLK